VIPLLQTKDYIGKADIFMLIELDFPVGKLKIYGSKKVVSNEFIWGNFFGNVFISSIAFYLSK